VMRTFTSPNKLDAYAQAMSSPIKMPVIILVQPFLDQNVGMVSRCMLNFGLHELRIVNPECDIHSEAARALAVGSVEVLNRAKIYSSVEECIADLDIVVATTARKRTANQLLSSPQSVAAEIVNSEIVGSTGPRAGIMFGRERSGLTNEELALANRRVSIPTFEHFEVLNLAQAVNLLSYECWKRKLCLERDAVGTSAGETVGVDVGVCEVEGGGGGKTTAAKEKQQLANAQEHEMFFNRLTSGLEKKAAQWREKNGVEIEGVFGGPEVKTGGSGAQDDMTEAGFTKKDLTSIQTLFRRANMNKGELRLLHGVLSRLIQ